MIPERNVQYIRDVWQPIFDAAGNHVQTLIVMQDITDMKRTEELLRQAQKMEAVGQLTGGVAHDFNNLLAVILGNLELIAAKVDAKGEVPSWIERAITAADRGASLTQRLLAFSRKQILRPEPIDADKHVRGMLELLRRTLGESVQIEAFSQAGLWLCELDAGQLENSILNIAINARDAMPAGGTLTIEMANVEIRDDFSVGQAAIEPGQYVLLALTDTGVGMTEAVVDRVFEPFFTSKDVGEGSGLGLSMVYGFVKQSGGYVKIHSEVGNGTMIKLYFPRYRGLGPEAKPPKRAAALPQAHDEKVLVVEDDTDLRAVIVRMLRSLGYQVIEAGVGAEALDVLRSATDIDLLLTDVVLPAGMSGRDLARMARSVNPNLSVLFMSGYSESANLHDGRPDEGVPFLQKPFRMADIARAVRDALAPAND